MRQFKHLLLLTVGLILYSINSYAQNESTQTEQNQDAVSNAQNTGNTNFLLTGYAFTSYNKEGEEPGSFGPLGFSPIFLWKKSDKLFFEGELEIGIEDGEVHFGLEYSTLHFMLNKYLTISAGKFLSPFGTYAERLHPAWIDKFAEKPLGFSEEGTMVGPMGEFGLSLRGGSQIGNSKINYVAYITNGPTLVTDEPLMAGKLEYENLADNNNNKALGGRLGFLPFSNSSLEIGVSGQTAIVGDEGSEYEDIRANMFSADISFIHKVSIFDINIKGQLNQINVDKTTYQDTTGVDISFDNSSTAYYFQLAIRPAFLKVKYIKNLELTGRYSSLTLPDDALWAGNGSQIGVGLNYWLNWNSVLKINYLLNQFDDEESEGGIFIQLAYGF